MRRSPESHRVHCWVEIPVLLCYLTDAYRFDIREVVGATVGACGPATPMNQCEAYVQRQLVK
jgi:hypothetical protein